MESSRGSDAVGPFRFDAQLWEWEGPSAWHFVTVPAKLSDLIAELRPRVGPGFGSVRVQASVGGTQWQTSVFPDKERHAYLLPVKATIRKRLAIDEGATLSVELTLL